MNHSTPGLPVHHQLPEFTQTHVHQVSDAIQPSHLLSSPSPSAPNLSSFFKESADPQLGLLWHNLMDIKGHTNISLLYFQVVYYFPWTKLYFWSRSSSVQFNRSVVSDSLRPHESQHTRPPCPSPTPGVHSDSRPSSQWCHPAISSSVVPFSSCPQSSHPFSNESTLHMRWPKYWSFSFSIIPSKEIPGLISFRMDWLDLLAVQGTLKSLLQHHSSKVLLVKAMVFPVVMYGCESCTVKKAERWIIELMRG